MTHVHRLAYSSLCLAAQPRSFRKDLFPLRANPVSMFHLCHVDLFSFLFSFARMCLKRKSEKTKIARPKINNQKCPPCGRTSNYRKSWAPRPQQLETPRLQKKSLSPTLVQPTSFFRAHRRNDSRKPKKIFNVWRFAVSIYDTEGLYEKGQCRRV